MYFWFGFVVFLSQYTCTSQAVRKFQNIPFMHMEPASFHQTVSDVLNYTTLSYSGRYFGIVLASSCLK